MFRSLSVVAMSLWCAFSLRSADEPNKLTPDEEKAGWKLVFDGTTTKGWRGLGRKEFPAGWDVVDGCLHHAKGGGDLTIDGAYQDFELSIEWKVAKGANSGIKYRVVEAEGKTGAFGPEYQVLDDEGHPNGKVPKTTAGSLYDVIAPSANKKGKPAGEFNLTKIVAKGNRVEHWLNGEKVVEYEFGSDAWKEVIAKSKFKTSTVYGSPVKGQICLQDHQDEVWFRGIKIKDLSAK
jgi:hypothetical protein